MLGEMTTPYSATSKVGVSKYQNLATIVLLH